LVFLFRCRLFAELLFDFVVVEVCDWEFMGVLYFLDQVAGLCFSDCFRTEDLVGVEMVMGGFPLESVVTADDWKPVLDVGQLVEQLFDKHDFVLFGESILLFVHAATLFIRYTFLMSYFEPRDGGIKYMHYCIFEPSFDEWFQLEIEV
jgi:hypothetical protein